MSETQSAPVGDSAATSAPGTAAAGDVGQSGAGDFGNAPEVDSGATAGEGTAPDLAAGATPAEFLFGGRKYRDQAHAENAISAMIGRQPHIQRENAAMQRRLAEMEAELQALHALGLSPGATQGGREEQKAAEALHEKLAKSGDLDFIAQLAENPEIGIKGALYELQRLNDERAAAREQAFLENHIQPMLMQREVETAMTGVSRTLRELSQEYPELDPSNESEEAQQAQAVILPMIERLFKPEALAEMPDAVLGAAVMMYREAFGAPSFAQPPGSSGAPSAFAAGAAEVAAGGTLPMEGNGVPRPGNGTNSPEDRIRRENRAINSRVARTPSGRPLGFEVG